MIRWIAFALLSTALATAISSALVYVVVGSLKERVVLEEPIEEPVEQRIRVDLGSYTSECRVIPAFDEGRAIGFKIFVRPGSLEDQLGFRSADIIHSANGLELSSPDKALVLYSTLSDARDIIVDITRDGARQQLAFEVEREPGDASVYWVTPVALPGFELEVVLPGDVFDDLGFQIGDRFVHVDDRAVAGDARLLRALVGDQAAARAFTFLMVRENVSVRRVVKLLARSDGYEITVDERDMVFVPKNAAEARQ